jgi:hypothetical protein
MEPTDAEKRKAQRTQIFLLVLMAVMISAPILIYLLRRP